MNFIDRQKEISRISRSLSSDKKRFIVVYGRRRLGKSTMIKHILGPRDVYFEADLNEEAVQMQLLVNTINMTYPAFGKARYDSWGHLLEHFNLICDDNCTLCLDEFPYLVKKCAALPSILQKFIDSGNQRFNIIICGSSQRMMENLILNASEPLYGRADEKICLKPIPIQYWADEFSLNAKNAIEEYAIWGGVPRYWNLREDYDDMWQAAEYLIFDEHGILSNEPAALFIDDTSEIASYSSIMTAVGNGSHRFTEIADAIGKRVTELSTPLKNLSEMAYLRKEVPFGENEEKSRKTLYQIADPFMGFYYMFVAPNKSFLALGKSNRILELTRKHFNEHVSRVWERLCATAISGSNFAGIEWGMASRWWGSVPAFDAEGRRSGSEDIEFDVVARSLDSSCILIGECKWNKHDFSDRLLRALAVKAAKVKAFADKKIIYVLFLREPPITDRHFDNQYLLYPEDIIAMMK